MPLDVVEVFQAFNVHDYRVRAGSRVMAWKRSDGPWIVYFNGNELQVPEGTVGAIGSAPVVKEEAQTYSSARLEQYQLAPK